MFSTNEQNLKEVIDALMRQLGLQAGYNRVAVYEAWEQVVGDMIAKSTSSLRFKDGVLYVKVNSPVIRQELMMARTKVLQDINELLGKSLLKEIVLY